MTEDSVDVGIVNYNGARYIVDTLQALARCGTQFANVMLVDNASTDESVALARQVRPDMHVLPLPRNLGPGAARNAAIHASRRKRLLLIDNDVALLPGCCEALAAALDAHPRAVIAMPAVLHAERPEVVQYAGAEAHFLGSSALLQAEIPLASLDPMSRMVGSLVSACLLVDRERFGDAPWFDESCFIYFEDHELGLRASLLGFDVLAVPAAQCLHGGGTVGISIRETGRFTAIRVRHTIRNRWLVLAKLYQKRTLLRFAPALAAFEIVQLVGAVFKGWLGHWIWAAGSFCGLLPALLRARADFRPRRIRSDLEVLVDGPFPVNEKLHRTGIERFAQRAFDAFADVNWRITGRRGRRA